MFHTYKNKDSIYGYVTIIMFDLISEENNVNLNYTFVTLSEI